MLRRIVNIVGGFVVIFIIGYYVYSFIGAESRVRNLCGKISIGMSINSLNSYAKSVGLGPSVHGSGTNFLVESKTFGRYGCEVEVDRGIVTSVKYNQSN